MKVQTIYEQEWEHSAYIRCYHDAYLFNHDKRRMLIRANNILYARRGRLYARWKEHDKLRSVRATVKLIPREQYIKDLLCGHRVALLIRKQGLK